MYSHPSKKIEVGQILLDISGATIKKLAFVNVPTIKSPWDSLQIWPPIDGLIGPWWFLARDTRPQRESRMAPVAWAALLEPPFQHPIQRVWTGWWLHWGTVHNIICLVVDLPLWKIWVRQLGWWHSQHMESHKSHVPNHQPVIYCSQHGANSINHLGGFNEFQAIPEKKKPSAWRSRGTSWNSISPDGDRLRLLVPWPKKLIIPMLLAWQICGLKLLKIGSCHSSTYWPLNLWLTTINHH